MASAGRFCYDYPRPGFTADIVLLRETADEHEVLLIQRGHPPFQGAWALPGGFVDEGEAPEAAARRELREETAIDTGVPLIQVGAFGEPGRDPRGWVVSVAYAAAGRWDRSVAMAGDDADDVGWWPLSALPDLAFDHSEIIKTALQRLGLASSRFPRQQ
jgi:8-oxo-dGTP diphosphatase